MNEEQERRIQNKIEQIRKCQGDYRGMHEELKKKRLDWWESNKEIFKKLNLLDFLPRLAFTIILFEYMRINPIDIQVIYEDEKRIIWRSFNFCPILEACKRLGIDTRIFCKAVNDESVQDFLSCINPKLKFFRNYEKIRPHAEYCEETFELVD
jgi:hypothetical protein